MRQRVYCSLLDHRTHVTRALAQVTSRLRRCLWRFRQATSSLVRHATLSPFRHATSSVCLLRLRPHLSLRTLISSFPISSLFTLIQLVLDTARSRYLVIPVPLPVPLPLPLAGLEIKQFIFGTTFSTRQRFDYFKPGPEPKTKAKAKSRNAKISETSCTANLHLLPSSCKCRHAAVQCHTCRSVLKAAEGA
jgi:hypothetical protein